MLKKLMKLTIVCLSAAILFTGFSTKAFADEEDEEVMELGEDLEAGDRVYFGRYEQDGNKDNGKEAIEWQVLDKKEDKVLLISKYVLDVRPYHKVEKNITWEKCRLRRWLNRNFLKSAFSEEEKKKIEKSNLENKGSAVGEAKGGKNTKDKVFLLSVDEIKTYLETDEERRTNMTDYAIKKLAKITKRSESEVKNETWYWLRSPGYHQSQAAYIGYSGYINEDGWTVKDVTAGIRPAIWVKIG